MKRTGRYNEDVPALEAEIAKLRTAEVGRRLDALELLAASKAKPHGCICPPTSEQTCGSPMCPRRAPPGYVWPGTLR